MKKVSIIIPVYNVESYISECLNSIVNQTFNNYEVILIDDGSTDNSGEICDKYSNNYEFITTIHKKNEGVSIARNMGIELSIGEYIVFIDSDDYLSENYLKIMYENIKKHNCDICSCNYIKVYNKDIEVNELKRITKIDNKKFIQMICDEKKIGGYLWNKIYKSKIIKDNKLLFDKDMKIMEDLVFNIKMSKYMNNAIHINEKLYCYRQREGSLIANKNNYNNFDVLEKIIVELENQKSYKAEKFKLRYIFENEKCKILGIKPNIDEKKHRLNLKKFFSIKLFFSNNNYIVKFKIILLHFFPWIYKI